MTRAVPDALRASTEDTGDLLAVTDLRVGYAPRPGTTGGPVQAVRGVDLTVRRGRVRALVGESGCGKSATALAVLGLLPRAATVSGSMTLEGRELVGLGERELTAVRGRDIGMIFQDPSLYLDPVQRVGRQIAEPLEYHEHLSRADARARAIELLDLVRVPDARRRVDQYPHEFSGGMRQRVMIASALACRPSLLVADEPTTALDVTVQAEILDLLRDISAEFGSGVLLITHDMGVVADLAHDVTVMRDGEVVEQAGAEALFATPSQPYTRELLGAVPRLGASRPPAAREPAAAPPALELDGLSVTYRRRLTAPAFRAVDGVSLTLPAGTVLGLVGESGSGKSTIARTVVGLNRASAGRVLIAGQDVTRLRERGLRSVRRRYGIVFQDPAASLNPRQTVSDTLLESIRSRGSVSARDARARLTGLLDDVRLERAFLDRYPRELSGGQRQRVSIARALALDPELLIADEPTSALDVSVQRTVLELLRELQRERGFACLFVTHDLAVVESLADHVAVLRGGRLVEHGPTARVLSAPSDDYTAQLLAAAPVPDPAVQAEKRRLRAARRLEQN
ncbi:dipeptide ABC transporter ATP-binding protein [Amycolatopsis solani]|uniref:dipeptide ABC transporter ATP-binding protein n=1 Tax=Amycolatopsis solani TaxID=3028615 RepID=UPI0025B0EBE1|nr:ABC transporter ATP-binding protein [Amycolatopsis sp. MEP2-6]